MPRSLMSHKALFRITAYLAFALCAGLMLIPGLFVWLFGLDASIGGEVMARRASVLFLAIGMIYFKLSASTETAIIQTLTLAGTVLMSGLAILGLSEWALGRGGPGIMVAVLTETLLAWLFLRQLRRG